MSILIIQYVTQPRTSTTADTSCWHMGKTSGILATTAIEKLSWQQTC